MIVQLCKMLKWAWYGNLRGVVEKILRMCASTSAYNTYLLSLPTFQTLLTALICTMQYCHFLFMLRCI